MQTGNHWEILKDIGKGKAQAPILEPVPQLGVSPEQVFVLSEEARAGVPMGQHFEPISYEITSEWLQRPALQLLLPHFEIQPADIVIDVGCASGSANSK